MMATIGTVNVKVVPEIDLESIDTQALIEAIAAAVVRKLNGPEIHVPQDASPEDVAAAVTDICMRGWVLNV